jgi:hypothetical protein
MRYVSRCYKQGKRSVQSLSVQEAVKIGPERVKLKN